MFLGRYGVRGWPAAALAASAAYLVFELAFSARLLDAVGAPGEVDVRSVEVIGRVLSGVAVGLLIWSKVVFPRLDAAGATWQQAVLPLAASMGLAISVTYGLQHWLIHRLVDGATADDRARAAILVGLNHSLFRGEVDFEGLPNDRREAILQSAGGKALLAFLPFAAGRMDHVTEQGREAMRVVVARRVDRELLERLGGPEKAYNNAFRPSALQIREAYNNYVRGLNRYEAATTPDAIRRHQDEAWSLYVQQLQRQGYAPNRVPRPGWERVRSEVNGRHGLDLPPGWNPADEARFRSAVGSRVMREAGAEWDNSFRQDGRVPLPRGLDQAGFVNHPRIQDEWRARLGLEQPIQLDPNWRFADWRAAVWERERQRLVDEGLSRFLAGIERFEAGRDLYEQGRRAYEALIVPPIALVFSLAGGLMHIGKLLSSALLLFGGTARSGAAVGVAAVLAVASLPTTQTNEALGTDLYARMERATRDGWGDLPVQAMRWVMQMQTIAYPIGDALRRNALGGLSFGVPNSVEGPRPPVAPPSALGTPVAEASPAASVPVPADTRLAAANPRTRLQSQPSLRKAAVIEALTGMAYADRDDSDRATIISAALTDIRASPDAASIDGSPSRFCGAAHGVMS